MPDISALYLEYGVTAVFVHKVKGNKKARIPGGVGAFFFFPDVDWNQCLFHYTHQNVYS